MLTALLSLLASPVVVTLGAVAVALLITGNDSLRRLTARPLAALAIGLAVGAVWRTANLVGPGPDAVREAARLGLAFLAFAGAQQVRLSRLRQVSVPATRLVALAGPGLVIVTTMAVFALLPALGLWSALLIAVAMPMGVGAFDERQALTAPLSAETKRTVRIDSALSVAIGAPLAILIEAISVTPPANAAIGEFAGFDLFAGAAVGGTIGLLLGRFLPAAGEGVPPAPLFAFAVAYGGAFTLGFDPVMAGIACGILYSEETSLSGPVRSRLFSRGVEACTPLAFLALGTTIGPAMLQADLLTWIAALVPALALRIVVRGAALGGTDLPPPDKAFLARFGGGPGAGAALFVLSLFASPSSAAQDGVFVVATLAIAAGSISARLASGPLVTRQVRAAARARRKRYGSA